MDQIGCAPYETKYKGSGGILSLIIFGLSILWFSPCSFFVFDHHKTFFCRSHHHILTCLYSKRPHIQRCDHILILVPAYKQNLDFS